MPSLESFNAFVLATGAKVLTDPDQIINDATKNTYMLSRMLKGRDAAMSVQSGQKIIERIMLTDSGTARYYLPNEDLDIQNVDNLTALEIDWRFIAAEYAYTQQEVTLNSGDPQTYYKNLLKSKRQACATSMYNVMEEALWGAPNNAQMEVSSGRTPYSIPAFVTSDGLAPSGFTTIETLSPATNTGWRNQTETYDPNNPADTTSGLVRAMDRMWHKVRFISPRTQNEYFESDRLQKMVIATNLDGITLIQTLTRDANDRLQPANNLGWVAGNVAYAGLPVEYISELNDALINSGSTIDADEPWFFYLNLNYLFPIFHTERYMMEEEPLRHPRQPFSYVVWKQTYYNIFCSSRRRQGLITPA